MPFDYIAVPQIPTPNVPDPIPANAVTYKVTAVSNTINVGGSLAYNTSAQTYDVVYSTATSVDQYARYLANNLIGIISSTNNYATLEAAVADAAPYGNTIMVSSNISCTVNTTVPSTVYLMITTASGMITLNASRTLTVNGSFSAPRQRVFTGTGTVTGLRNAINMVPQWWGAVGDGITDDTAAFTAMETACPGTVVDLGNTTYSVTAIPIKEDYRNGSFYNSTANSTQVVDSGFYQPPPTFHTYGGQLRLLKEYLGDPLQQIVSIVLIGDSITWGSTTPQSANVNFPSAHAGILSDSRDNEYSPSWANELRRYIGREYANGNSSVVTTEISNWAAAGSNGNCITTYTTNQVLYPVANTANTGQSFTFSSNGASITGPVDLPITGIAYSGYQMRYGESNGAGTSNVSVSFGPFTGNTFNVIYAAVDSSYMDYTIFANGVNIAANTFASAALGGDAGITDVTNNNKRVHTFTYVRNASIEIRSRRPNASNTRHLRINAIEVPKKIRITNQGISGSAARVYLNNCLSGAFAPPRAIGVEDNFVLMQLGTNDRIVVSTNPNGVSGFSKSLQGLVNDIKANSNLIMMCALPAKNQDSATYSFSMQECRDTIMKVAKRNSCDFIDNYAIFPRDKTSFDMWLTDGLHPNTRGHYRIYRNIVGALEQAGATETLANAAFYLATAAYANANTAIYTAAQIRANISNTDPILYDPTTGIISHKDFFSTSAGTSFGDAANSVIIFPSNDGHLVTAANVRIAIDASQVTSGTLVVARGGTGQGTYTNGQILIGNTGSTGLDKATIAQSAPIIVTNLQGSITLSHARTTVVPVDSYGSQAIIPVFAVDANGHLTAVVNTAIGGLATTVLTTGILSVARGGTGKDATGLANGQLLIGNTVNSGFDLAVIAQSAPVIVTVDKGAITISHARTTVVPATYGSQSLVPVFAVDANGHLTSVTDTAIGGLATTVLTTGILSVARGGTGKDATGLANGQLLIGNTVNSGFDLATIAQSAPIIVTIPGKGAITISHARSGVTAVDSYGSQAIIPVFAVDANGHLTAVVNTAIGGLATTVLTTGILSVARGGTGKDATGLANGQLLIGNTVNSGFDLAVIAQTDPVIVTVDKGSIRVSHARSGVTAATLGGSNRVLGYTVDANGHITATSNVAIDLLPAASITTGILSVARGGTGKDATGLANGQLLIANTVNSGFDLATVTAGSGIIITNDKGSITVTLSPPLANLNHSQVMSRISLGF